MHERTAGRATYFCRTRVACYSLANCPCLPFSLSLRSRTVRPTVLYLRSRRTASPFYPLSFILYPLYPGLPRQADASAPNGIMRTGSLPTLFARGACLIFPIGLANCATHGSPRPLHRASSLPSLAAPVRAFANAASFLSSSLPLSPRCAARPIKESRPTPVCVPDTQSSLSFPRPRPLAFRFPPQAGPVSSRLVSLLPTLHPICFLKRRPWPPRTASPVASRCVSPRNCISYTRPPPPPPPVTGWKNRWNLSEACSCERDRRMKVRRGQKCALLACIVMSLSII